MKFTRPVRILLRLFVGLAVLVLLASGGAILWLHSKVPSYSGTLPLPVLQHPVDLWFDEYGIPHIRAEDKLDMYRAFGYVHASERLFQMEMLRRAGSGRLAEFGGEALLPVDIMFRSLGLNEYATRSDSVLRSLPDVVSLTELEAYLEGVNHFIQNGPIPAEFTLMGIPAVPFTTTDVFLIAGAMSYSFSQAQKTEPVIDFIARDWGAVYLNDMGLWHGATETFTPTGQHSEGILKLSEISVEVSRNLPFAPLEGSNSWALSGSRTASKKPLFCNDTHIGYLLPQTWYEAYLECPGFELYGHFLGGVPFALVGRNKQLSWGLTMLLNDDMDFYREEFHPEDSLKVMYKGQWVEAGLGEYRIEVKGSHERLLKVRTTPHGPVVNDAFPVMGSAHPVAVQWTYTSVENHTVDAFRGLNNARDLEDFGSHLPLIHAPGLNITYADAEDNVAWWACASLIERPRHANSRTILNGATGDDDLLGYYPFDRNPRHINPKEGFIVSANEWFAPLDSLFYPGYYNPNYRADRIRKLLRERTDWDVDGMKALLTDVTHEVDRDVLRGMLNLIQKHPAFTPTPIQRELINALMRWDGRYHPDKMEPVVFQHMLYHFLAETCKDELGDALFEVFLTTHQAQRTYRELMIRPDSPWYDDQRTPDVKETRSDIILRAFNSAVDELSHRHGPNWKLWKWEKVCSVELKHPLGTVAALRPVFNLGPRAVTGSNETIRVGGFTPSGDGQYRVYFGSQMRIITDFSNSENSWNITPAGQSGHRMSPHYNDQFLLYMSGEFRKQHFGFPEDGGSGTRLLLTP